MFDGLAFMVNGNMACGLLVEVLMVRVWTNQYEEALARPYARVMDSTGWEMKGYVFVDPQGFAEYEKLENWARMSLGFVLQLPAK